MPVGDGLQPGLPGPQPVSSYKIGVDEPLAHGGDQVVDLWFAALGQRGHACPGHIAIARSVRRQRFAVGGQDIMPSAVHVDLRHGADHGVGIGGRRVQQRAVGFGQRGRRRDDEHHRRRRLAGHQIGRLDERVLGQSFAQCRGHAADPGQPRPGHQDHIAARSDRRTEPRPDRRYQCIDCFFFSDRVISYLIGHAELPALDHSRSEPLTMSAPQAPCKPATGPRR